MVIWCIRAVKRVFLSLFAASRILSSPCNVFPCRCVQVTVVLSRISFGHRPSLRSLRQRFHSFLFGSFLGTMPMSDFSAACMSGSYAVRFLRPIHSTAMDAAETSRFSCIECPRMLRVFDSAGPVLDSLDNVMHRVAFPTVVQGRRPRGVISELNGWPALSPVNASRTASRLPAHDSGP